MDLEYKPDHKGYNLQKKSSMLHDTYKPDHKGYNLQKNHQCYMTPIAKPEIHRHTGGQDYQKLEYMSPVFNKKFLLNHDKLLLF